MGINLKINEIFKRCVEVKNEIPHVIHYCWFGGKPLPQSALKCIESWRKYFPDYGIKEWNESNFDVNAIPYTAQAYEAKKYAFVSDYARFKILYEQGGLYFDTDVEVIRPMDDIIQRGPFMGCEKPYVVDANPTSLGVAPGLGLAAPKGFDLYREILDMYEELQFLNPDGSMNLTTIVEYTGRVFSQHGLRMAPDIQQVAGVWIYPNDYFAPKNIDTKELVITSNTRSIHWYDSTWAHPASRRAGNRAPILRRWFGKKIGSILNTCIYGVDHYILRN